MADAEDEKPAGAMVVERVGGHEWRVELREHHLKDWKRQQGMPTIVIVVRLDGELLATLCPTQVGGTGIQLASDVLNFDEPIRIQTEAGAELAPAVIYVRKGTQFPWPEGGNGSAA